MNPIDRVLDALRARGGEPKRYGDHWQTLCPAHPDENPSLSISVGNDGKVLLRCFAGCPVKNVVYALGLEMADLFPAFQRREERQIITTYDYTDENGQLLYQIVRYDPKDFRARCPGKNGNWIWNLKKTRRVLYHLPEVLSAVQSGQTVFVCEGEKDVESLCKLGLTATTNPGGAGKWRSEYSEALHGAQAVIVPDKDEPGRKHAAQVTRSLHGVAARVKVVELPGPGKDVTDWVQAGGTQEDLFQLIEQAPEWEPSLQDSHVDDSPVGLVKRLADAIAFSEHFAQDQGSRLYRFSDDVYKSDGAAYVRRRVKALLEEWSLTGKWSSHKAEEVIEYIRVDSPELWDQPPRDVINVKNGLLHVSTRELKPHSPEHLSSIQINAVYNPDTKCPAWEKFVSETFPGDARNLAYEIPAALIVPSEQQDKALLLEGEGANGKSTYLRGVISFLGRSNISGVSLHKLESDRFSAARLIGKLANICPDLPSSHLESTSTFKTVTGGDVLLSEYKFKDSFEFKPFSRLVFSANHFPRSSDGSHAFFRRWVIVPFPKTFDPSEQIPSHILDAQLSDPSELSGLLNQVLDALRSLRERGTYLESESMRGAWEEFRAMTDPVAVWLDRATVEHPDAMVTKDGLLSTYNAATRQEGGPTMTRQAFGRALRRLRPNIQEAQRKIAGKLQWVWLGLGLKSKDDAHGADNKNPVNRVNDPGVGSRDSLDSRDSSLLYINRGKEGDQKVEEREEYLEQSRENPVNRVNGMNETLTTSSTNPLEISNNNTCVHCDAPANRFSEDGTGYCEDHL
ncbi:hypothetical protein HYR54_10865 [Candidatus Acetothermia bacterium]|nr:hypothetical protein [Candidatus Acetothermia bacterium]